MVPPHSKDLEFLFQDTSHRLSSHSALYELITDHSDILNTKSPENLALFQKRPGRQEVSITDRMPRTETTEYFMSVWREQK
jgi:hypothetical protein